MGEVVEFRHVRAERELERHFGLPRGAAYVQAGIGDRWADRHDPNGEQQHKLPQETP